MCSLTSEAVGSTLTLPGSTVVIILPQADSTIFSFSWDSEIAPGSSIPTLATYIESQDGEVRWNPRSGEEKLTWILGLGELLEDTFKYRTKADVGACDQSQPCTCFSFQVLEISTEGYLVEVARSASLLLHHD